ncbi:chloramphenicol phosphotransferase CPT family protein [Nocardia sp. NBC_01377]|uniref:chloramphenicol phosphotransferase CPT family protein n=1 Tax=Nocardia sp. NBC_01377 TaxID=2903595 RepID=UPI0032461260
MEVVRSFFDLAETFDARGAVAPGQIVFLNGASSSGKSSLARRLLIDLDRPFFHMGVDMIGAMRSETRTGELDPAALAEVLRRTRAGFHRAVAGMALAGNDIVVDHVLGEPWRLRDCLTVMAGIDVVLVGVHCSLDALRRRERRRGDRVVGTAAAQVDVVHAHGIYDLEVDTGRDTVEVCSARVAEFLERGPMPRAFDRLRAAAQP